MGTKDEEHEEEEGDLKRSPSRSSHPSSRFSPDERKKDYLRIVVELFESLTHLTLLQISRIV